MESDILFKENTIAVYTTELDHSAGGADPEVLVQDRLKKGSERLDNALELSPCCASQWSRPGRAGAHVTTEGQLCTPLFLAAGHWGQS
jgi:hypothetical protein